MSEEFRIEGGLGDGRAVELDEGARGPCTQIPDGLGDQGLAGPRFPGEQDCHVRARHPLDQLAHPPHAGMLAEDAGERAARGLRLSRPAQLLQVPRLRHRALEDAEQ